MRFVFLKNEKGDAALMLFPLFIVFMVIAGMAAAEFAVFIIKSQRIAFVVREAAYMAASRCGDVIRKEAIIMEDERTNIDTYNCLKDNTKTEILNLAQDLVSDFNKNGVVYVSIWSGDDSAHNNVTPTPVPPHKDIDGHLHHTFPFVFPENSPVPDHQKAKYNINQLDDPAHLETRMELEAKAVKFHRVIVAEGFYDYSTITPLSKIFKISMPRIYEVTVF